MGNEEGQNAGKRMHNLKEDIKIISCFRLHHDVFFFLLWWQMNKNAIDRERLKP